MKTFELAGKQYQYVKTKKNSCDGCDFRRNIKLCNAAPKCWSTVIYNFCIDYNFKEVKEAKDGTD